MRFFLSLFLSLIFLITNSYAMSFENADALIEEAAKSLLTSSHSALVFPMNAQLAENITQTSRGSNITSEAPTEFTLLWHPHILSHIGFLFNPQFTSSRAAVLVSQFFPNREISLLPNTVAVNDPIGKLNPANQKKDSEKQEAAFRLGSLVRVVQEAFESEISTEDLVHQLMQVWGVQDPSKIKILNEVINEDFAKQEAMEALIKLQSLVKELMSSYERGEGENLPQEDEEESPEIKAFKDSLLNPRPLTEMVRRFIPTLLNPHLLHEGDLEKFMDAGGMSFSDKNLMILRKRQLAFLIAQQVIQEKKEGRGKSDSSALACLMAFFWQTSKGKFLKPFYKGYFGNELPWDEAPLEKTPSSKIVRDLLETIKGDSSHFWRLSFPQQTHVLHLDLSLSEFKLPTSGMAEPFLEKGSYSDCVETTIRCGNLALLRNPITGEMEPHLFPPKTPFRDYFISFSDVKGRFSPDARNFWAEETWKVPGTSRVHKKFGFIPSLENVLLTLQFMMSDPAPVVHLITLETNLEDLLSRYRAFLVRASRWYSEALKREVSLDFDEDGIRLLREEKRTVGLINLKTRERPENPWNSIGYMNIMPHHGEYVPLTTQNSSSQTAEATGTQSFLEHVLSRVPEGTSLVPFLPWVSPSLINGSSLSPKIIKELMSHTSKYFSHLNYDRYPDLYVSILRNVIVEGTPKDQHSLLQAASILRSDDRYKARSECILMIHKLLINPETAPKISSRVLKDLLRGAPNLLECQGPYDPLTHTQSLSLLEILLERGDMETLRQAGPMVSYLYFDFSDKMKTRTEHFWSNLSSLKDAFPRLEFIHITSNFINWSHEEKSKVSPFLGIFKNFSVKRIFFSTLTPETLEFLLPVISEAVRTIEYSSVSENWQATQEQKLSENQALCAKFLELQTRGSLPQNIRLRAQGELAALARDH